jgi:hypothetical protein
MEVSGYTVQEDLRVSGRGGMDCPGLLSGDAQCADGVRLCV